MFVHRELCGRQRIEQTFSVCRAAAARAQPSKPRLLRGNPCVALIDQATKPARAPCLLKRPYEYGHVEVTPFEPSADIVRALSPQRCASEDAGSASAGNGRVSADGFD